MKNRFSKRMNQAFEKCPGAVDARLPQSPVDTGYIAVEPECAKQAKDFLRRRFIVNDMIEIEVTGEIKFEIVPRTRKESVRRNSRPFAKPEQFELQLR